MNPMPIELIIIFLLCLLIAYLTYAYFILKKVITTLNQVIEHIAIATATEPKRVPDIIRNKDYYQQKPIGVTTNRGEFVPVMSNYWAEQQRETDNEKDG